MGFLHISTPGLLFLGLLLSLGLLFSRLSFVVARFLLPVTTLWFGLLLRLLSCRRRRCRMLLLCRWLLSRRWLLLWWLLLGSWLLLNRRLLLWRLLHRGLLSRLLLHRMFLLNRGLLFRRLMRPVKILPLLWLIIRLTGLI